MYYHVLYTPLCKIRTGEITKERARAAAPSPISQAMGKPLPYTSLVELRRRMSTLAPHLADNEMGVQAASGELTAAMLGAAAAPAGSMASKPSATPLKSIVTNFYMTDPVSRASATMAKCVETFGTRV